MAVRQIERRKLRKVAVGDLRDCISLEVRAIQAPVFGSASFTEAYTVISEPWCKVETQFNARIFDDVATDDKPSHLFTIRWREDVTTETRIRWRSDLYRIQRIDNFEGRDEYLLMYASIEGDESKEASQ